MRKTLRALAAVATLAAVAGCRTTRLIGHERPWPEGGCRASEGGRVIVCEGREVARVECRSERHEGFKCRNLAVRYADGEVASLHHAGPAEPAPYPPDKVDLEAAYGPVVARDGRTIWFRTRTPRTEWRTHEYDVATGVLRDVDAGRVRAAVDGGRALPLGAAAPDAAQ
jgi:hypothetical protein